MSARVKLLGIRSVRATCLTLAWSACTTMAGCGASTSEGVTHRASDAGGASDRGDGIADAGASTSDGGEHPDAGKPARYASALAHLFALSPAEQKAIFAKPGRLGIEGCNRVSYEQVPGSPFTFIGRSNTEANCSGSWFLMRNQLVAGPTLHAEAPLFAPQPSVTVGPFQIGSAYDPTVALFGGRVWVAFECAGVGITSAATCAAPLDSLGQHFDLSGLAVVVSGNVPGLDPGYDHSASVPKLVVHRGHLYLYWTVVRIRQSDRVAIDIRTLGSELAVVGNQLRVVSKSGAVASGAVAADSGIEVWGLETDTRSNVVADAFQMTSDGTYVYATAGLGGDECINPTSQVVGCYRLAIARTTEPLGPRTFNALDPAHRIPDEVLPANAHEYSRIHTRTDGSTVLYMAAQAMPKANGVELHDGAKTEIPPGVGLATFELPSWDAACSSAQKAPDWGIRDGVCTPSCGGLGGTSSAFDACALHGTADVGAAWDVPFCCK